MRSKARRIACPFLTGHALLSSFVLGMALVMLVDGDPDASAGPTLGFGVFTASLVALLVAWYRPLFPDRSTSEEVLERLTP